MILKKLQGYLINILLIWSAIIFYSFFPYYRNFIRSEALTILIILGLSYTILGFFYHAFFSKQKKEKTKGEIIGEIFKKIANSKNKIPKLEPIEKTTALFLLVKFFFLPIMLNFMIANFNALKIQIPQIINSNFLLTISAFNYLIYPFLLAAIFFLDTLWFSFGYTLESSSLKNKIRSVEPTLFGWVVALLCYPPFNGMLTNYLGWYANDYVMFSNETITFIVRISIILLLGIYVSATFALGTKCSNLTNRGIVSSGPYKLIRHPAYISKNLAWWLTLIPILSWKGILGMGIWSIIYHFRSLTEEKHLKKDPDYVAYCKKVKYRYIPGVY